MNRHRLATLGIPALALCVAAGWTLTARHQLPDPVASHFDFSGRADGFLSLAPLTAAMLGVGGLLLVLLHRLSTTRLMSGAGAGMVIFLAAQRGLADAADATLGPALPLALAVGVAGGLLVGVLADPPAAPSHPEPAGEVPLHPGSRAVWFGRARVPRVGHWITLGALFTVALLAVMAFLDGAWVSALLLALGAPALLAFLEVRVRVDARGTHWQLLPGFPRGTIPHDEVTRVGAVDIRPGDWGCWGWRVGVQGQAVLIRGGEGLRIQRGRKNLYITVDDAARGAALIEAYRRA